MNADDLDQPRPVLAPHDLQGMSINELKQYIVTLQGEISRAQTMIESKEAHRSGADSLFA
ncbi:MAG: DUF1192 family protein [Alphaproteobacteria bacterium]|nr:DUF1192 family protein [Alphaproteobacteria bacterium]